MRITNHALARFIERVAPCTIQEAHKRIMSHAKAIEVASAFGCEIVRCGGGERLVLDGTRVLTVYGRDALPRQCRANFAIGRN